ncbi:MAG: metal-dependent hydrolase [Fuerstiella sp.]|nr:metal-dependent hydrolase [Fuerstiella sp.]MCP4788520.1 metal-dependent hydrolase [Fuerstiella sp.]MCP4854080.1 metal-dependent hydrolase [Fuerstiella sp.]
MKYIDPHIHMVSRTTDDYQRMAQAGCIAITEPAFWAGFDRSSAQGFYDYFRQLTEYEPKRAAQFGIQHFTWLCINPKEADDPGFAREVVSMIPDFLNSKNELCGGNVLGIGEIGLNKNTKNELIILEEQIALAETFNQLVLVHTPHLEDKLKGTRLIMDALSASTIDPGRILIDHVEEHTVSEVLDRGFWAGMTLYPDTKVTPQRAADIIEMYGDERIWMNSAGDWGCSDPLAVPKAMLEMRRRGHAVTTVDKVTFDNPQKFLSQSPNFSLS